MPGSRDPILFHILSALQKSRRSQSSEFHITSMFPDCKGKHSQGLNTRLLKKDVRENFGAAEGEKEVMDTWPCAITFTFFFSF